MDSIGQKLKKARKLKNLKISDVAKELRISKEILKNFETDNLQDDINTVFLIGHLRSYCGFLDLDQTEILRQFKDSQIRTDKLNIEIKRPVDDKNFLFSNKLISFALIITIFSSFYFLFIEVDKPKREYALIPDLPENYIATIEKANVTSSSKIKINEKNENDNLAKQDSAPNSSSAIASVSKNAENKSIITLKFLDDTWIQLRDVNDEIVLSQLMNKNDEYSYDVDLNYSITSGNAGHIMVLIDQIVRGKIGKKGEVVDSLVLNKEFIN
jgi:cytoskeletal protein RodZ